MGARTWLVIVGAFLPSAACGGDAYFRASGRDAILQVEGADYVAGDPPPPSGGPRVAAVNVITDRIHPGEIGKACSGSVDGTGTSALLRLAGDRGYWILRTGVGEVDSPTLPAFRTNLAFAKSLALGEHALEVRAVDPSGRVGDVTTKVLTAESAGPTGALVVRLAWKNDADLDLHVVDPAGVEIWKRDINSIPAPKPGEARDPEAWRTGGILDVDSNAACVIDGRRVENVVWEKSAPKGHYLVRVETASMCATRSAFWTVDATLADGTVLGRAQGASTDADTRFSKGLGSGVLALEFDVP
ncbi:MAG: hypothetical protein U0169_01050 [Polyangiaceae bacterium]